MANPKFPLDVPPPFNDTAHRPPHGIGHVPGNPPNGNGGAIALAVICVLLTSAVALLRAHARLFAIKKIQIEDLLGLCAFGCYVGTLWSYFRFSQTIGFFVHKQDIEQLGLIKMGYIIFIWNILYQLNQLLVKVAILLEWTRIFTPDHSHNLFFWASRFLICATILGYLGGILGIIIGCLPPAPVWRLYVTRTCLIQKDRIEVLCTFNIILDTFILILPQRVIWKLQMSRKRKFGISLVFSVGILVCICAAGRLGALLYVRDSSYFVSLTLMWTMAEETCALLVFCVPSVPKAFNHTDAGLGLLALRHPWTHLFSRFNNHRHSQLDGNSCNLWMPLERGGGSAPTGLGTYRMDEEAKMQGIADPGGIHMQSVKRHDNPRTNLQSSTGDEVP